MRDSEQSLRLSEGQMIMAQQIGHAGSWIYSLATDKIWGSAEGLRIFGYPPVAGEFPIDDIEACIPEQERVHQALVDLISEGREYNLEYAINPADGSPQKIILSIAKLEKDAESNPLKVLGFIQDITERKQTEAALRLLANEQSIILDNAGVGITFVQNRQFKWTNTTLCRIFGYSPEEITDANTRLIYPSQEDYEQTGQEAYSVLATGKTYTKELLLRRSDGSLFHALYNGRVINPADPIAGSIWIISDETERYELQKKLVKACEAAESANRAKSEFLANMSHEIRTPMNGLLGMAQLLEMTDLTQEQQGYVDTLKVSGKNLMSLINDILDLSKIEAGKIEIGQAEFSLLQSIKDIVKLQKQVAYQKGLSLDVSLSNDIPKYLLGDSLRLKQILLNLLGNAIKFTIHGGITIKAELLNRDDDSVLVQIVISDTGIGIAPEALDKIFKPFVQEDGSISRKYGGTGLGLSISSRLAELMGGSISIESRLGVGSYFTVTLPFSISNRSSIQENLITTWPGWNGPPLRILLVEDDEINTKYGVSLLKKLGLDVVAVVNGMECLEALEHGTFDLVLMDINMPVMNGEEALLEIRRKEQESGLHLPVIAVTAYSLRGEKERFLDQGFDGYVSKPLTINELLDEMKRVVNISS